MSQEYGQLPGGRSAQLFTLTNENGLRAEITNFGGILVRLFAPDRGGKLEDIVLGKDTLQDYLDGHPHFGCLTGRVAGRIGKARFELDDQSFNLVANNGPNCLHGGDEGFDKVLWEAEIIESEKTPGLQLSHSDPHGSNGFPGTVDVRVTYALLADNSLQIRYHASTNRSTPFNITNHSYFNLAGHDSGDVLQHEVQIFADAVATVDADSTLLGRRDPVVNGYNDYRTPVRLADLERLEVGNADIHFFLKSGQTNIPKPAAVVREPKSGRTLQVFTTQPGVQFYAGLSLSNNKDAPEKGKDGASYPPCGGFCLETQDYPDSINFPEMGNALLHPDEPFESITVYRFGVES